jgi:hypothetical protein
MRHGNSPLALVAASRSKWQQCSLSSWIAVCRARLLFVPLQCENEFLVEGSAVPEARKRMKRFTVIEDVTAGRSSYGSETRAKGVRGWLLVLCLMMVVIGPGISVSLLADSFARFSPYFAQSTGLRAAIIASMFVTTCSVAFGIYGGLSLWLIRVRAVRIAKLALLIGLASDIVATAIETIAWHALTRPDGLLLLEMELNLIPSLAFFTACFAYLVGSDRVHATYGPL